MQPSGKKGTSVRWTVFALLAALAILALEIAFLRPNNSSASPNDRSEAETDFAAVDQSIERLDPEPSTKRVLVTRRIGDHWLLPGYVSDEQESADELGILSGRVLWRQSGQALVGARVGLTTRHLETVIPTHLPEESPKPLLLAEAMTNLLGEFILDGVPDNKQLVLFVGHSGLLADIRKVAFVPKSGEELYYGDILIDERGSAAGFIVDEEGTALAGVRVRGIDDPLHRESPLQNQVAYERIASAKNLDLRGTWFGGGMKRGIARRDALLPFPETRTLADGSFTLNGLRPGKIHLLLQLDGYASKRKIILVDSGGTIELGPIRLEQGERLELTVKNRRGRPREGVLASISPQGSALGPEPIPTDSKGRVTLILPSEDPEQRRWPRQLRLLLRQSPTHPWQSFMISRWEREITLDDSYNKILRVVSRDSRSIQNAEFSFTTNTPRKAAVEIRPGVYLVSGLLDHISKTETGAHPLVIITAEGYAPAVARLPLPDEVEMLPSHRSRILVTNPEGRPVPDARVRVQVLKPKKRRHRGSSWHLLHEDPRDLGRTDHLGILEAEGMWDAEMRFLVDHPEHGAGEIILPRPPRSGEAHVIIYKAGGIRGYLTRNGHQPAFGRWRIVAEPVRPLDNPDKRVEVSKSSPHTLTNEDGSFSFPDLAEGPWSLRILAPEVPLTSSANLPTERLSETVHVVASQIVHVTLDLSRNYTRAPALRGHLTINGQPAAGLRVFTQPERSLERHKQGDESFYGRNTEATDPRRSTQSDSIGYFEIQDLDYHEQAGALVVQKLYSGEWVTIGRQEIAKQEPDHDQPLCVDLFTGALRLELIDHLGFPLGSHMFRLISASQEKGQSVSTAVTVVSDRLGFIDHKELPVGRYRLKALGEGSALARFGDTFSVVAGMAILRRLEAMDPKAAQPSKKRP